MIKLLNLFASKIKEQKKVEYGLNILGFNENIPLKDKYFLINEISNYIFDTSIVNKGKKTFDLELDYKYYYTDFRRLGIDLNKDNISWWEFDSLLEGIFLTENSTIGKVLQYRTYEKPPTNTKQSENSEHKFYMEKKRQYALPTENNTNKGFMQMDKFLTKKVGE